MRSFEAQLRLGELGESIAADLLRGRGWCVARLGSTQLERDHRGPCMTGSGGKEFALADIMASRNGKTRLVEVKTYKTSPINRTLGVKVHGIGRVKRSEYISQAKEAGMEIWLMVIEVDSGEVLCADLQKLEVHPCACSGCKATTPRCTVEPRDFVYFPRANMQSLGPAGDEAHNVLVKAWGGQLSLFGPEVDRLITLPRRKN